MKRKALVSLFVGFVLMCAGTLHAQQAINLSEATLLMGRTVNNRIPSRSTTAVLPFTTGFPALSDHVTGETITALGKNPLLTVTPLGSMKQTLQNGGFKLDTELSNREAQDWGRRLQVKALVFGSIQPSGGSYRLTVTAIEVAGGQVYWTNTYLLQQDALLNSLTKSTPADRQAAAPSSGPITLNEVIIQAGKAVEEKLKAGSNLAVLNFTSPSETFSDYIQEELTGVLVRSGKLSIIERRSLDLLRKEMNTQLSGDVSDTSAVAIGKQLGAQDIVTGSITNIGSAYRVRIKVINVETARIEAQVSYDLKNDDMVVFLMNDDPPIAVVPASQPAVRPGAAGSVSGGTAGAAAVKRISSPKPEARVIIPNSFITRTGNALYECKVQSFTVDRYIDYVENNGILFDKQMKTLIRYPPGKNGTSYTIPNSVTTIGDFAFYECSELTSVTIPNSVTSIGNGAFYECSGLTNVTIPNSVTTIGAYTFYGCSGLTNVTIPNSVTTIGAYTFFECSELTSVTIPNSVTTIGEGAFVRCSELTSVTIPNSVTSIGNGAFYECSGLTSVSLPRRTKVAKGVFPPSAQIRYSD